MLQCALDPPDPGLDAHGRFPLGKGTEMGKDGEINGYDLLNEEIITTGEADQDGSDEEQDDGEE